MRDSWMILSLAKQVKATSRLTDNRRKILKVLQIDQFCCKSKRKKDFKGRNISRERRRVRGKNKC
jgi:hypothetical protein